MSECYVCVCSLGHAWEAHSLRPLSFISVCRCMYLLYAILNSCCRSSSFPPVSDTYVHTYIPTDIHTSQSMISFAWFDCMCVFRVLRRLEMLFAVLHITSCGLVKCRAQPHRHTLPLCICYTPFSTQHVSLETEQPRSIASRSLEQTYGQ